MGSSQLSLIVLNREGRRLCHFSFPDRTFDWILYVEVAQGSQQDSSYLWFWGPVSQAWFCSLPTMELSEMFLPGAFQQKEAWSSLAGNKM